MEEGLDESVVPLVENLRWRLEHFEQPFDTMTNHLQAPFMPKDANDKPILPGTQTWPTMAKIARYLTEGENGVPPRDWQDRDKAKHYVKTRLGTEDGETLLLELLPLPKSGLASWPPLYNERFPEGLAAYWSEMFPKRCALLKRLATIEHEPTWVICYGKGHWKCYEQIFTGVKWTVEPIGAKAKVKKGVLGGTTVVLTPFFGMGAMSNSALAALCALLKQSSAID
jgi:hypothetical protein